MFSFPKFKHLGEFSVSLGIGGASVPRPAAQAVGTPEAAWTRVAHASCVLIQRIGGGGDISQHIDAFKFACEMGHVALQKLILHKQSFELSEDEKGLVNTVGWGLSQLNHFAAFIYGGLI
jgi:hypothetical protein